MRPAYETFSSADFLTDDSFVTHQLTPTPQSTVFWANWLDQHPHRYAHWQQAVDLLKAVRLGLDDYAQTQLSEEAIHALLSRIKQTNAQQETLIVEVPNRRWARMGWVAAACVLLALGVGFWFQLTNAVESPYEKHLTVLKHAFTETINTTTQPQSIHLADGSDVSLAPGSRLSFAADFGKQTRTVYLSGEATFEVTKNPHKPFLVYANEVVTKVLGTKFIVRAFEKETEVRVDVQSGQVSVYRDLAQAPQTTTASADTKGVLLLPNQQVVFSRQTEQFNKTLVDSPHILATVKKQSVHFSYDETPIARVFQDLKDAYGIDIRFNQEALVHCQLSASLEAESFEQKLDIICKTVGATYEILDGQVIVNGGNCQ
ncbi:DUF4974 domain-containing protein [Spirosoma sp. KCTC 42546]|uniref:FecR family protein n=1 Tax=Spirosoma sp. KCTC 42546 TaxID=2520506 RepID=UPI00115B1556|nr:FecR family protein [Spirosoma sp. KCTC 42546]QDK77699.1 DUF4974 domain-containing protein [Spirosoma sp. KCTC 42546]